MNEPSNEKLGAQLKNPSASKHNRYIWELVRGAREAEQIGREERTETSQDSEKRHSSCFAQAAKRKIHCTMVPTKVKSKVLLNSVFFALFFLSSSPQKIGCHFCECVFGGHRDEVVMSMEPH